MENNKYIQRHIKFNIETGKIRLCNKCGFLRPVKFFRKREDVCDVCIEIDIRKATEKQISMAEESLRIRKLREDRERLQKKKITANRARKRRVSRMLYEL